MQVRHEIQGDHTVVQFQAPTNDDPSQPEPLAGEIDLAGAVQLTAGDFATLSGQGGGVGASDPTAVTFQFSGGIVSWTVPETGTYDIVATGASGGAGNARQGSDAAAGGFGAMIEGIFTLTAGEVLTIAVGEEGKSSTETIGPGGGGGGSFVVGPANTPLLIGGGGGGGAVGGNASDHRGLSATSEAASKGNASGGVLSTAGGDTGNNDGGGGGGNGGSFSSLSDPDFGTATASGNGLVVITQLSASPGPNTPAGTDWNALAAQVTANHAATGHRFL